MGNRDISKLTPDTQKKREELSKRVKETYGYDIFITDGFRTNEEQNDLYAQGRTTSGPVVTYTTDSIHEYGKAFDIAFKGSELYPGDLSVWKNVAKVGKEVGLDWGYDMWGRDKPHFQNDNTPIEQYLNQKPKYSLSSQEVKRLNILLKVNSWFRNKFPIQVLRILLHSTNKEIRVILSGR